MTEHLFWKCRIENNFDHQHVTICNIMDYKHIWPAYWSRWRFKFHCRFHFIYAVGVFLSFELIYLTFILQ